MKSYIGMAALGLSYLLCGGLMADSLPSKWVTIQDNKDLVQIDFPHFPQEMSFDTPFQNTPPQGQLRVYSSAVGSQVFILSTFTSSTVDESWLEEERLRQFFNTLLIPKLFFNPSVFHDKEQFKFTPIHREKAISFEISYRENQQVKKIEGIAKVKDKSLCLSFYAAPKAEFNEKLAERFLDSFQ